MRPKQTLIELLKWKWLQCDAIDSNATEISVLDPHGMWFECDCLKKSHKCLNEIEAPMHSIGMCRVQSAERWIPTTVFGIQCIEHERRKENCTMHSVFYWMI